MPFRSSRTTTFVSCVLGTLLAFSFTVNAVITNVTIDDTWGDEMTKALPTYTGPWATAESCAKDKSPPECSSIFVDSSKAFNNTYHNVFRDVSILANVSFTFNGTDLYVFFIVPDLSRYSADPPALTVDLLLDGGIHQSGFIASQSGAQYTTTGFAIHGLTPEPHTVKMLRATEAANTTYSMAFDYALYTADVKNATFKQNEPPFPATDDSTPDDSTTNPAKKSLPPSTIGGIAAGVFSFLVIVSVCRRFSGNRRGPVHAPVPISTHQFEVHTIVNTR